MPFSEDKCNGRKHDRDGSQLPVPNIVSPPKQPRKETSEVPFAIRDVSLDLVNDFDDEDLADSNTLKMKSTTNTESMICVNELEVEDSRPPGKYSTCSQKIALRVIKFVQRFEFVRFERDQIRWSFHAVDCKGTVVPLLVYENADDKNSMVTTQFLEHITGQHLASNADDKFIASGKVLVFSNIRIQPRNDMYCSGNSQWQLFLTPQAVRGICVLHEKDIVDFPSIGLNVSNDLHVEVCKTNFNRFDTIVRVLTQKAKKGKFPSGARNFQDDELWLKVTDDAIHFVCIHVKGNVVLRIYNALREYQSMLCGFRNLTVRWQATDIFECRHCIMFYGSESDFYNEAILRANGFHEEVERLKNLKL